MTGNSIIINDDEYFLANAKGDVIRNLSKELGEMLTDATIDSTYNYIQGEYDIYNCLFDDNGSLIKAGLTEIIDYIPQRDEFIVIVNEEGDSEVVEYRRGGDNYWGVIDSGGKYVVEPRYDDKIEYFDDFDFYLCDNDDIYYSDEIIGKLDNSIDIDNNGNKIKLFKSADKFGIISTDGILLTPQYDLIYDVDMSSVLLLTLGKKLGIYDYEKKNTPEFIYDEIKPINDIDECYLILTRNEKKAIYDYEKNRITEFLFDHVSHNNAWWLFDKYVFHTQINELNGMVSLTDDGKHKTRIPNIFQTLKYISYETQNLGLIGLNSKTNRYEAFNHYLERIDSIEENSEEASLEEFKKLLTVKDF
jgi:hypothetical protein